MPMPVANKAAVRPRALTYIRKRPQLQFSPRYDLCKDPDMQIIELIIETEPIFIINIYNEKQRLENGRAQSASSPLASYTVNRRLIQLQVKKPTVLAGDFNLHHL